MAKITRDRFRRIDILVNNAGINDSPLPTIRQNLDDWQRVIDTHLKGSYLCSKIIGEQMIKQRYGKILMISSIAGIMGLTRKNAYSSAKAGMIILTKTLAAEWGRYNINVNAIAPGFVFTPLLEKVIRNKSFNLTEIKKRTPLGVLGQPKDIANAVLFLCSDDAKFITGITLPVDGGLLAWGGIGGRLSI